MAGHWEHATVTGVKYYKANATRLDLGDKVLFILSRPTVSLGDRVSYFILDNGKAIHAAIGERQANVIALFQ